jgi:hypothetical protein
MTGVGGPGEDQRRESDEHPDAPGPGRTTQKT